MLYEGLNISDTFEFDRLAYKCIALHIAADATFFGDGRDGDIHNALEEEYADELWTWIHDEGVEGDDEYDYVEAVASRAQELYDRYTDRARRGVLFSKER